MTAQPIAQQVAGQLAPYLGSFNAQIAVKTFAKRAFDLAPEELTSEHLPGLLEALRPMLVTLAGRTAAGEVLERIQTEVT